MAETIRIALKHKQVTSQQLRKVTVDTTVQEKAIAFPTDARHYTAILMMVIVLVVLLNKLSDNQQKNKRSVC
ncbi:MAG: hypothetical protein K8R02_02480 [Anaerohalosphaeraceae bacterium]|nr:hypothetical protein [Anaerohalosphaeraceae bacterium]